VVDRVDDRGADAVTDAWTNTPLLAEHRLRRDGAIVELDAASSVVPT
jgi:hypothetical protein